jgi:DNA-binding NarL/FixJ family response regulator
MQPTSTQIRVLIVDDHPMVREIMALACDERPSLLVVGQAGDGLEALEQCALLKPDVVVLDLGLPGMISGFEVLVRLRYASPSIRVLVVSGRDDREAIFESVRLGAQGYLVKTGTVSDIAAAVEAIGGGAQVFSVEQRRTIHSELGDLIRWSRQTAVVARKLTGREHEVLQLMATGLTTRQIANRLGIAERTAESHLRSLYRKLDVASRGQAVHRATQMNLVDLKTLEQTGQ